jgi:hypothetical protein
MMERWELQGNLQQFTGTEQYHYSPMYTWLVYTDGAKYFFEKGGTHGAYWLLDLVGSLCSRLRKQQEFMTLDVVSRNGEFKIKITDGDEKELLQREGGRTDLQEGTWRFFMRNGVLMLPSEY